MPSTRTSFIVWNHILTDQGTGSGGVPDFKALYGMPRLCEVNNDQIGIANTTTDGQTATNNAINQAITPPSSGAANASIAGIKALSRYQQAAVFYDVEGTWTQGADLYGWNNTDGHVQTTLSGTGITNANQNVDTANKWNTTTSLMRAAWTADGEPGAIQGVYGFPGGNSNYAYQSAYSTNWRAGNDAMVAGGMLAHIDYLAPSMYKSFDDMSRWDAMFAAYMTESDRMRVAAGFPNMPIYAFLQPEVDNTDGSQTVGDYMTSAQWRHQLDTCFANPLCWGVVIWHEPVWGPSGVWGDANNNTSTGYFAQTLAFMQANQLGIYAPTTPPPDAVIQLTGIPIVASAPYEDLEVKSGNSLPNGTLPFVVTSTPFSSANWVLAHVMAVFPPSIDNANPDYYTKPTGYNDPAGDASGAWGAFMRDAPPQLAVDGVSGWQARQWNKWILQFKAAGGDGFTVDMTDTAGHAATNLGYIFAGAAGTGVKVSITFDMDSGVWNATTMGALLDTYSGNASYHMVGGSMFVMAYDAPDNFTHTQWGTFLAARASAGKPVAFVPVYQGFSGHEADFDSISIGHAYWGTSDTAGVAAGQAYLATQVAAYPTKRIFAPVRPQFYRTSSQQAFEGNNLGLLKTSLDAAIGAGCTGLLLATANDYSENSHIFEAQGTKYGPMTLQAYYTERFKTGAYPAVTADELIYAYRKQRTGMVPTTQTALASFSGTAAADQIRLYGFLVSPGTLEIDAGSVITSNVSSGLQILETALTTGITPVFKLKRSTSGGGTSPPAAVSGVTVSQISSQSALISWADNSTNEVDDLIEIETPSGSGNFVSYGAAPANSTSKVVTGLPAGSSLRAGVTARNAAGNAARVLSSAFSTLASTTGAEGEETRAAGIGAQTSLDGLQPAPTPFASGNTFTAQHVARATGGGAQTDSLSNYGFAAIDTEDVGQHHIFKWGSSISTADSTIVNSTVLTGNFGGTTIGNTPDSGSGSNGYSCEVRRNTNTDAWNVRLLTNSGPAPSFVLASEPNAFPAGITGLTMEVFMLSAGPMVILTPNTGAAKTYVGTDPAYRGTIAGTVDRTDAGTIPIREMRFNVATAPASATITPNNPTVGGQAIRATGTISPPTVAGTVSVSLLQNGVELTNSAVTATVDQSTGAYSAVLIATQPGQYKARVRIGSGQPVDSTGFITMLSISGLVQA